MTRVNIYTPRLVLCPPKMADAQAITQAKKDMWPQLQKWMSWAYEGQQTFEATLHLLKELQGKSSVSLLAGFCCITGKLAVVTGLEKEKDEPLTFHTGFWAAKDFLGRGYATEATNAAIRYAFKELDSNLVTTQYYEGNEKSRRVIEKLGFDFIETVPDGHARCSDGLLLDVHQYAHKSPENLPDLEVNWEHKS